jgi:hypothetical protein
MFPTAHPNLPLALPYHSIETKINVAYLSCHRVGFPTKIH